MVRIGDVELQEGTTIADKYRITAHLGAGGFAQVFEAFDTNIERPVAIKFLNLHTTLKDIGASNTIVERFKREAKLAARVQHPNVVNIFDFGVIGSRGDVPYIVMELLAGHDLEVELQKNSPLEADRALRLFVGCLEALGQAHELGIVHKDLKPSNLFVANPGEPTESLRIVDFGIAHLRAADEGRLTAAGEILGTPQYLSPEYIEAQLVTPAFDVYQMGLVLVEALTGRAVVDEDHPLRCVKVHSMGELDVPTPLLESQLGPVIIEALAHDHRERFADASAFGAALARVDAATLPEVGPATPSQRLSSVTPFARQTHDLDGDVTAADDDGPGTAARLATPKTITALVIAVLALSGVAVWLLASRTSSLEAGAEQREATSVVNGAAVAGAEAVAPDNDDEGAEAATEVDEHRSNVYQTASDGMLEALAAGRASADGESEEVDTDKPESAGTGASEARASGPATGAPSKDEGTQRGARAAASPSSAQDDASPEKEDDSASAENEQPPDQRVQPAKLPPEVEFEKAEPEPEQPVEVEKFEPAARATTESPSVDPPPENPPESTAPPATEEVGKADQPDEDEKKDEAAAPLSF